MAASSLAIVQGDYNTSSPSSLLHSIFMSTVSSASKTLLQVASNATSRQGQKWKATDHLRYMLMLSIWLTVWVLRLLIDHFPCSVVPSPPALLDGIVSRIFALVNELPATSREYQFAVAMAERIVEENSEDGHETLREINRTALSCAFHHTTALLCNSLHATNAHQEHCYGGFGTCPSRVLCALPLGSHLVSYLRGIGCCLGSIFSSSAGNWGLQNQLTEAGKGDCFLAEKLAQELVWIMDKMRYCSVVEEAIVQWSFPSGLASLSVSANPRIQGPIIKITAILFREMAQGEYEIPRQVKFRMLMLWMPLFCYASNGLAFPVLTGYEKTEVERVMEKLILSLPAADQEVILNNWLQDFIVSSSDWPNLQRCYDRWCRSSRKLLL